MLARGRPVRSHALAVQFLRAEPEGVDLDMMVRRVTGKSKEMKLLAKCKELTLCL